MFYPLTRIIRQIRRRRAVGVTLLFAVLALSILGNTLTFYFFDRTAHEPELSVQDSFWYSLISITTIGYGDLSAVTPGARAGTAIFIILIGLAGFTTAVGMLVDWIVDLRHKERTGMGRETARNHLVIVNFPSESRVRQIIEEFSIDRHHRDREIIVVTDDIEQLPFHLSNVSFVRGSPLDEDTYHRADVGHAMHAIILSSGYDDPRSDSFVASVAFVIQRMNPDVSIVAEVIDPKRTALFDVSKGVSLVYTLRMANNLLVQETQDPGVNLVAQAMTSNQIEGTLSSTVIDSLGDGAVSYIDVAKGLLDHDINLVGVVRDGSVLMSFSGATIRDNDSLVYISSSRHSWSELSSMLSATGS